MTSSFLENVKNYFFSQAVSRYCTIKRISIFGVNHIIKNLTLKIFFFLFHGLSFDILDKKKSKKVEGHQTNYLLRGPNLNPPPHISRIIQYKTLRSVIFVIFIIPYYLYEVILHYKAKHEKEEKKQTICNKCPRGNRPWSSGYKV